MRLVKVEKVISNDRVRVSGLVLTESENKEIEIYFEYPECFASFVDEDGDVFLPALLIPSMFKGEDLTIDIPVSKRLCSKSGRIQDIFQHWYPHEMKKIKIVAPEQKEFEGEPGHNVGAFFSLGADSFFTLYQDQNGMIPDVPRPITHLIYMKGLELPLSAYSDGQEKEVISKISEVAKSTRKDLIVGETNIRDLFPLTWGPYYYGAGLASCAHSLSRGMSHVMISSTLSYRRILAWGSTPLMDHLWSTEKTKMVHVGAETQRSEKVGCYLSQYPLAMKYLRVCFRNNGGAVQNCGKCYKCVRTMTALHITGNLEKAETFPHEFSKKDVIAIANRNDLGYTEEVLELAQKYNSDTSLINKLQHQIDNVHLDEIYGRMPFHYFVISLFSWFCYKKPLKYLHDLSAALKKKNKLYARLVSAIYR
ncbi:MAG: hypothetical protein KAS23_09450 [Anaerohalosphaera sp.]|nr:hypothetical protein [Anaerohalosphaera sp.]